MLRSLAHEPDRRYQQASDVKSDVEDVGRSPAPTSVDRLSEDAGRDLTHMKWCLAPVCSVIGAIGLVYLGEGMPEIRLGNDVWIPMTLILSGIAMAAFLMFRAAFRSKRREWKLVVIVMQSLLGLAGVFAIVQVAGGGDGFISAAALVLTVYSAMYAVLLVAQITSPTPVPDQLPLRRRGDSALLWVSFAVLLAIAGAFPEVLASYYLDIEVIDLEAAPIESNPPLPPVESLVLEEPVGSTELLPIPTPVAAAVADPRTSNLHEAAEVGALLEAAKHLASGADLHAPNREGLTPLMSAARSGQWQLAGWLLAIGARPDSQDKTGRTALMHAVENELSVARQKSRAAEVMLEVARLILEHEGSRKLLLSELSDLLETEVPDLTGPGKVVTQPIRWKLDRSG